MRYRTTNAAQYLGVSPRTLEKWRVVGGGPRFAKMGATVVYDQAALDTFLHKNERTCTSGSRRRSASPQPDASNT